jgi:ribonucleotide monophosphatase NagD (HAD superfamily)
VKPEEAVHIGDDRRNDLWGARDAGCDAWLWGSDVHSFKEVKSPSLSCKSIIVLVAKMTSGSNILVSP